MSVMREQYAKNGYIKVEGLFEEREMEELRQEIREICAGRRGAIEGLEPLPRGEPADDDAVIPYRGIHFPHKVSPLIARFMQHDHVAAVLCDLLGANIKSMQSAILLRHPGKPGQAWCQDESHIPTRDRSLCGVWIALDRATRENGCLRAIPGSHKPGILWPTKPHDSDEFEAGPMSCGWPYDPQAAVACEVDVGGAIFFNGYLLHCAHRSRAASDIQRALVCHYMTAESWLPWSWEGRLPLREDMRDIVMVSGKDPYAYKGVEELTHPFAIREA